MGIIIRQSIKNTIIQYVGIILGFVCTILLFPRALTSAQYGLTRVLLSLAIILTHLAQLGVKNIIIRFFPYFQSNQKSKGRFFTLILLIPAAGFLLFILGYVLFKGQILDYYSDSSALFPRYYLLLIPLVFGILLFKVLDNYFRALRDTVTGSFLQEILFRTLLVISLLVCFYHLISFFTFMIFFVGCYLAQPVCMLILLYRRNELNFEFPKLKKRARLLKNMFVFGGYTLMGGLAKLVVNKIDIIMLGAMTDLSKTGVYAIAFYVGSAIVVPQRSILKIASPILAGYLKDNKYHKINSLYKRTSLNQIIAGSLLYIGILANMHNLIVLLPPEFRDIKWLVVIIGFAKLFNMATGINGGIIVNSKYFRFDLYINIFLVIIAVATNYYLIPLYGLLGAAIATLISVVTYNSIKLVYVYIKFSMQPFQWSTPLILFIAGACLWGSFQIPYLLNFFVDVTIRSLAITVVFIGTILLFGLSDDVQNLTNEALRRTSILLKPKS